MWVCVELGVIERDSKRQIVTPPPPQTLVMKWLEAVLISK